MKIVTVFGATGHQGGSLAEALLKEGFAVRGISRKVDGPAAVALTAKGVDMRSADITTASEADLKGVLDGSYGAFLLTNFWDPTSMGKEADLGKKLVDAAAKAGVQHILWSGLDDVGGISKGKWHVPHFTDKAKVTAYIRELQSKPEKPFKSFANAMPSFYYQNFKMFGLLKREGDKAEVTIPAARFITACDIHQFGPASAKYFLHPEQFDGKRIEYWGEHAHPQSYVNAMSIVSGLKVTLKQIPVADYAKLPYPGSEEFAHMMGWFDEFSYYGPEGQPFALHSAQHQTPGGLTNFESWLRHGGAKELGLI